MKVQINLRHIITKHFGLLSAIVLALLAVIFLIGYYPRFLAEPIVGGWDGEAHFRVMEYYANHIFPNLYGFVPTANAGFAWPVGYPPLTSFIFGLIFQFTTNDLLVFKLIIIALLSLTPWLFSRVYAAIDPSRSRSFTSGVFFLIYLAGAVNTSGPNFYGTLLVGLYPQLIGFIIFLVWLASALKRPQGIPTIKDSILLALLLLANLHLAEAALCICFVRLLFDMVNGNDLRTVAKRYTIGALVSLGLVAFWLVPFLSTSTFFQTATSPAILTNDLVINSGMIGWGGFLIAAIATFACISKQKYKPLVELNISLFILAALSIIPISVILPGLPLQPVRLIEVPIIFSLLSIPLVCEFLIPSKQNKFTNLTVVAFLLIVAFLVNQPFPLRSRPQPFVQLSTSEQALTDYLKTRKDGRSLVEVWNQWTAESDASDVLAGQPTHSVIASVISNNEHETLWGVLRESNLNSTFTQSIRNGFSANYQESYGIVCFLCADEINKNQSKLGELINQQLELQIARARLYGVKYYVVRSPYTQEILAKEGKEFGIVLTNTFGNWQVFADTSLVGNAAAVTNPLLVFTQLQNRDRQLNGTDWMRLNEELIFSGHTDITMALAANQLLDQTNDLDKFNQAFIANYTYRDLNAAYTKLANYAQKHKLILLAKDDALFTKLKELPNVKVITQTTPSTIINEIINLADVGKQNLISGSFDQNQIKLQDNANYKLVRYSYFPWWNTDDQHSIYMTSPALMLVVGEGPAVLNFSATNAATIAGVIISLLTVMGIALTRLPERFIQRLRLPKLVSKQ